MNTNYSRAMVILAIVLFAVSIAIYMLIPDDTLMGVRSAIFSLIGVSIGIFLGVSIRIIKRYNIKYNDFSKVLILMFLSLFSSLFAKYYFEDICDIYIVVFNIFMIIISCAYIIKRMISK